MLNGRCMVFISGVTEPNHRSGMKASGSGNTSGSRWVLYAKLVSTTPGGTTFTQGEEFTGLFSFVMRPLWGYGAGLGTKKGFERVNGDLKVLCERGGR